jgi:hypothetical protein
MHREWNTGPAMARLARPLPARPQFIQIWAAIAWNSIRLPYPLKVVRSQIWFPVGVACRAVPLRTLTLALGLHAVMVRQETRRRITAGCGMAAVFASAITTHNEGDCEPKQRVSVRQRIRTCSTAQYSITIGRRRETEIVDLKNETIARPKN